MNCVNDNNKAVNSCSICNKPLCEECSLKINLNIFCKECLLNNNVTELKKIPKIMPKSNILVFFLSFFPGLSQMYLGYIKRGIILFALGVLLFKLEFLELLLILGVFSLFDGFKLNNDLRFNIYHEDNLSDIFNFIKSNKFFLIILIILILGSFLINIGLTDFLLNVFDFMINKFEDIFDFIFDFFSFL